MLLQRFIRTILRETHDFLAGQLGVQRSTVSETTQGVRFSDTATGEVELTNMRDIIFLGVPLVLLNNPSCTFTGRWW